MRHLVAAVLLTLMFPAVLFAQELPPPVLLVEVGGISKPLQLNRVDTDVQIVGHVARTRMIMTFYNPNRRAMAGDLVFPLPEGATVSGYGLDVNGVLVDGVVVEKDKGRQVFEIEVRKGIDPGLIEWVKGNNFRTRVFPIPPEGTRTVSVTYVTTLLNDSEGTSYYLPLNFKEPVADFHLRVEVVKSQQAPKVRKGKIANFEFARWRESFLAESTLQNATLTEPLVVALPDLGALKVQVQKSGDGRHWFALADRPNPPKLGPGHRVKPERITVLWDASGSRGGKSHEREIGLLGAYLKSVGGKVDVSVVLFRNDVEEPVGFAVDNGDVGALTAFLEKVDYDGGTQMGIIGPRKGEDRPAFYFLFTDGLSNFGKEEPAAFKAPVYAFSADATANHPFLRYLAQRSGGEYFNLSRLADPDVLARIGDVRFSFVEASVIEGEVEDLLPASSQPVQGDFFLAGRLKSDRAVIEVRYGIGGGTMITSSFTVERSAATEGELLRTFWAQKHIDELLMLPEKNKDELVQAGREFGLVTPGTSLIVLESLGQYVEHRIEPPESIGTMRKEYFAEIRRMDKEEKAERRAKIDRVLDLWKERVSWWETEFKYPKDFRFKGEDDAKEGALMGMGSGGSAAVGMGRAAAPAAMIGTVSDGIGGPGGAADSDEREQTLVEESRSSAEAKKGKAKDQDGEEEPRPEPTMTIKAWDPDTPYLKVLKKALETPKTVSEKQLFRVYMGQRAEFGTSPAFFLDCADFFFRARQERLALQVLSNVAELELENPALLRVLGHRLAQQDLLDLSRTAFEEVLRMRPEEPQSFRDLALVLGRMGEYPRSIELLYHVVLNEWDRFQEIELTALEELNRIIVLARKAGVKKIDVDERLVKLLDVDVRIVLTWDTDMADMDIWVTEPSGEKAMYNHNRTTIGGLVSRDFTQGYGPEEYMVRKAMRGKYRIEANYYGSSNPALTGAVTLQAEVFTDYGRPNEKRQAITVRLEQEKQEVFVGEITF